jgi:hypothetical protein
MTSYVVANARDNNLLYVRCGQHFSYSAYRPLCWFDIFDNQFYTSIVRLGAAYPGLISLTLGKANSEEADTAKWYFTVPRLHFRLPTLFTGPGLWTRSLIFCAGVVASWIWILRLCEPRVRFTSGSLGTITNDKYKSSYRKRPLAQPCTYK